MAFAPKICVIGNLVADPEVRFTPSGAAVCAMRLASTPSKKVTNPDGSTEWQDETTLWLKLTAWRQLAENCAESLKKGMEVIVWGSLKQSDWEDKEGNKRSSFELMVDAIGPSLARATATVNKAARSGGQGSKSAGEDPWTSGATAPAAAPAASWTRTRASVSRVSFCATIVNSTATMTV